MFLPPTPEEGFISVSKSSPPGVFVVKPLKHKLISQPLVLIFQTNQI
jgi:hypothetical protein